MRGRLHRGGLRSRSRSTRAFEKSRWPRARLRHGSGSDGGCRYYLARQSQRAGRRGDKNRCGQTSSTARAAIGHRNQHPHPRRQGTRANGARARRCANAGLPDQRHGGAHAFRRLDHLRQRPASHVQTREAGARRVYQKRAVRRRLRQRHQNEIHRQPSGGDL